MAALLLRGSDAARWLAEMQPRTSNGPGEVMREIIDVQCKIVRKIDLKRQW